MEAVKGEVVVISCASSYLLSNENVIYFCYTRAREMLPKGHDFSIRVFLARVREINSKGYDVIFSVFLLFLLSDI